MLKTKKNSHKDALVETMHLFNLLHPKLKKQGAGKMSQKSARFEILLYLAIIYPSILPFIHPLLVIHFKVKLKFLEVCKHLCTCVKVKMLQAFYVQVLLAFYYATLIP